MSTPTDTEMLNWLGEQAPDHLQRWVCVFLMGGVVLEYRHTNDNPTDIRMAIAAAMEKQRKDGEHERQTD